MIAIFIRLLENDHNVNFFGWDIPVGEKTLKGFALAIPFALVLSLIFKLYTVIWITREGQKFFDYLAEFTFDLGKELQLSHGTFNSGDISSMIKYDVRYAAVSYMHVLRLFYPLFVSIGILVFAYFFEPFLTTIVLFSILIVLPFHIILIMWGSKTAERIREGAIERSKEIESIVSDAFSHPNKESVLALNGKIISESPGNIKFMDAYVDRQRLSGFSSAISEVTILIAVVVIVLLALEDTVSGVLTLSNLILGFIIFRFLMSNTSSVLQAITSIGALQPFFYDLLKFISPRKDAPRNIVVSGLEVEPAPFTVSIITFNAFSPWTATSIGSAIDAEAQTAILTASFRLHSSESWQSQLQTTLPDLQQRLDKRIKKDDVIYENISNFLRQVEEKPEAAALMWNQLSIAGRLALLATIIPDSTSTVILNGTDCLSLSDANWATLHKIISGRNLVFLYNKCPRRLRFGGGGQIAVLSQDTIKVFDNRDFNSIVDKIQSMQFIQRPKKERFKGKDMEYDM